MNVIISLYTIANVSKDRGWTRTKVRSYVGLILATNLIQFF
jgi:hypothetical protein